MLGGASTNEIILVALLLVLVLLAPKISRIGEALGALFAGRKDSRRADRPASQPPGRGSPSAPPRRGDTPPAR